MLFVRVLTTLFLLFMFLPCDAQVHEQKKLMSKYLMLLTKEHGPSDTLLLRDNPWMISKQAITWDLSEDQVDIERLSSDAAVQNGAGGILSVSISLKADWTLTSDVPWLEVSTSSGKKGHRKFTVTTYANMTDTIRTGVVSLSVDGIIKSLVVRQRPYVFYRREMGEADVINALRLRSEGTEFTRIYSLLSLPVSNLYQDISNLSAINKGQELICPDGINHYLFTDVGEHDIPQTGGEAAAETFHVKNYLVVTNLNNIMDIPAYDPNSDECRRYLGKEDGDYVDPFYPDIVALAERLWNETSGNLIAYARACFDWTAQNLTYSHSVHAGMQTMDYILRNRVTDCSNFASVFISLLRAKGIPARHVSMISPWLKNDFDRRHSRAEFYIPAYGWIPADPTFQNSDLKGEHFGVFDGRFIVMTRGINLIYRGPDKTNTIINILNSRYWYWYSTGGWDVKFSHEFSFL